MSLDLSFEDEKKYFRYLKKRYGKQRAKDFSRRRKFKEAT